MKSSIIDLRSDTLTKPTPEMRKAMSECEVGDDVYGEDPTINRLQSMMAELFGKESALFVPTGVMGNQIAIAIHTQRGDEIIVESESHIFHYETAAPAVISGVQMYCIPSEKGEMSIASVEGAIRHAEYYYPKTALICIEHTHNRHGGTILSIESMKSLHEFSSSKHLPVHCDGARIWNACIATGIEPKTYGLYADSLSVCLSKGLGTPAGSVILGSKDHIEKARHWRKLLGGGMRQAGILAAAGIHALENHRNALLEDHHKAQLFASLIEKNTACKIANSGGSVETNIVIMDCGPNTDTSVLLQECAINGVRISTGRGNCLRAVFHRDVSMNDIHLAAELFTRSFEKAHKSAS